MYANDLQPLVIKGVRGLGKYLPVASSEKKEHGKVRSVPKTVHSCPTLFFKTGTLVPNPRIGNDQQVVKKITEILTSLILARGEAE